MPAYRLELSTSDLYLAAGEPVTETNIKVISAHLERATLLAAAAATFAGDVEHAAKRHRDEVAHIEHTIRQRIEAAQAEPDTYQCQHCGQPIEQQDTGIWENPAWPPSSHGARYCDNSTDHLHHA